MVHLDMSKPDRDLTPGVDLWEIRECNEKRSTRGNHQMLSFKLARVSNPSDHMYDNVMLEGAGWGIGREKLLALIEPEFCGELDPTSLISRRLWVGTAIDEYQGKRKLKVDIDQLDHNGFQRLDNPPAGCTAPEETPESITPF